MIARSRISELLLPHLSNSNHPHHFLSTESRSQEWEAPHRPSRATPSKATRFRKPPKLRKPFTAFNFPNNKTSNQNQIQNDHHNNLDTQIQSLQEQSRYPKTFLQQFKLNFLNKKFHQPNSQQDQTPTLQHNIDEIFNKIKETGFKQNAVSMLDALCKDGLTQEAMQLISLMHTKTTIPDLITYTAVVEAFCKAHKFDEATRIFKKMGDNGITPNAFTYTVLIQGLCEGKCYEDAFGLCVEMLEAGYSPNVGVFVDLVNGFCNDKGVEEAGSVVRRMREKGYFVHDEAVRDCLDNKGYFSPLLPEAIFGKRKTPQAFV